MIDLNIDEMEAGPELDALIAERALGWRKLEQLSDDEVARYIQRAWQSDKIPMREDIHRQRMKWIIGGECDCARWMRPDGVCVMDLPPFSITWQAIGVAVKEMRSQGYIICLLDEIGYEELEDGRIVNMCRCEFMDESAHDDDEGRSREEIWLGVAQGRTIPHAIALAIVKAKSRILERKGQDNA